MRKNSIERLTRNPKLALANCCCFTLWLLIIILYTFVYSPHESMPTCFGLVTFPEPIMLGVPQPQPEGALHDATAGSSAVAVIQANKDPEPLRVPRIVHIVEREDQSPGEIAVSAYASHQRARVMFANNYTTMRWNLTGFREWMAGTYAWYLPLLDTLTPRDQVEVAPYFILDVFGGIAISAKYVPRLDLHPYLAPDRVNMLESNMPYWEPISPALLASAPKHPLWTLVHTRLLEEKVALGAHLMGEMHQKYPVMTHVLPCRYFNRVPERSTHWIKKNTALRRKCGVTEDPCLYGSLLEYSR